MTQSAANVYFEISTKLQKITKIIINIGYESFKENTCKINYFLMYTPDHLTLG